MKVKAKKDLFLDGTDKRLFTKGEVYTMLSIYSYYNDGSLLDDTGFNHVVKNDFIEKYFIKVGRIIK